MKTSANACWVIFIGAISCSAPVIETQSTKPIDEQVHSTQRKNEPQQPLAEGAEETWANLLELHGEGLLPVKRSNVELASVYVTNGELVVFFDDNMAPPKSWNERLPIRTLDYVELARKLGATQVGGVPLDFELKCGENHGGDFEVQGAKYGIYTSGICHHVRFFDLNADAVRLLLGEEFVAFLDACDGQEIGPICMTKDRTRIGAKSKPLRAAAEIEFQSFNLEWDGVWLDAKTPTWADKPIENVYLVYHDRVDCVFTLPEISEPGTCGLSGESFEPVD